MKRHNNLKSSRKKSAKQLKDKKLRLFIDPASISSGWAIYRGKELKSHGTISVDKKQSVFIRLRSLASLYTSSFAGLSFDEVHIEQLPRRCHVYTHWSVGVIGTTLQSYAGTVSGDIAVRSWQKHTAWERLSDRWKTLGYSSEDAYAAVCMGQFYTETKL